MNINNQTQQTAFTGTFRFKPNEIKAKLEIPNLFTQGKQIGNDILEKGDLVVIIRDNYDKRIGSYIKEKGVTGVEYYPTINTKSGFDFERPEEIIAVLKDKSTRLITNFEEMFEVISKQKRAPKPAIKGPSTSPKPLNSEKEFARITKALRLNIENPDIKIKGQHMRVYDKDKRRTLDVIAHSGTYYAYLRYDGGYMESIMCTLNGKGEIIKKIDKPEEIHKFLADMRRLIQENSQK